MTRDRTANELYNKYEKYILPTIKKQFPEYETFTASHGLTLDDLEQYGRIGLYKATKSYDDTKGYSFLGHAIQNIIWSINVELKKDSLYNENNKSLVLIPRDSLDSTDKKYNDEELDLHEVVGTEEVGYDDIEVENLLDSLEESLPERVTEIVRMRYKGFTFKEIGKQLGVSAQYCEQSLRKNKENLKRLLLA